MADAQATIITMMSKAINNDEQSNMDDGK